MYEVGQVLYTILEDKKIVIPVRVVEQVITKTITGKNIDYKFQLPNTKEQKVSQEKFSNLYNSLDEAEAYLLNNAKGAIEKMMFDAISLEEKFFEVKKEVIENNNVDVTCKEDNNSVKIDLGDGQMANIDMTQIGKINSNIQEVQKKTWAKF